MTPKRYFAFGCLTLFLQVGVLAAQNNQQTMPLMSGIVTGSPQAVTVSLMMQTSSPSMSATSFEQQQIDPVKQIQVKPTASATTNKMPLIANANVTKPAVINTSDSHQADNRKKRKPINNIAHKTEHIQQDNNAVNDASAHSEVMEFSSNEVKSAMRKPHAVTSSQGSTRHTVELPKPTFSVPPSQPYYPKKARKRGLEGTATVEVMFNQMGEQLSLTLVDSSGFSLLDAAALEAVGKWQFAAPSSSEAYAYTVRIPVKFALN